MGAHSERRHSNPNSDWYSLRSRVTTSADVGLYSKYGKYSQYSQYGKYGKYTMFSMYSMCSLCSMCSMCSMFSMFSMFSMYSMCTKSDAKPYLLTVTILYYLWPVTLAARPTLGHEIRDRGRCPRGYL